MIQLNQSRQYRAEFTGGTLIWFCDLSKWWQSSSHRRSSDLLSPPSFPTSACRFCSPSTIARSTSLICRRYRTNPKLHRYADTLFLQFSVFAVRNAACYRRAAGTRARLCYPPEVSGGLLAEKGEAGISAQTALDCGGHTGPRLELLVPHRAWLTRHHLALQPGLAARAAAVLAPHRRPASPAVVGVHVRRTVRCT